MFGSRLSRLRDLVPLLCLRFVTVLDIDHDFVHTVPDDDDHLLSTALNWSLTSLI